MSKWGILWPCCCVQLYGNVISDKSCIIWITHWLCAGNDSFPGWPCLSLSVSLSLLIKYHKLWCISLYVMVALFPGKQCWVSALLLTAHWKLAGGWAMPIGCRTSVCEASWWGTMSLMKVLLCRAMSVMFTGYQGAEWENFFKSRRKKKRKKHTGNDIWQLFIPVVSHLAGRSHFSLACVIILSFLCLFLSLTVSWCTWRKNHNGERVR